MPIRRMEDKRESDRNKLKELAFLDDLTSLYNRRYLYRYLPIELNDMKQISQKLCLFMMDVDTFKKINDTYGHLSGDKLLRGISDILRQCLREGDTIVRYAGDEFIAILPGVEKEVAVNIANRIIDKIDKSQFKEIEGKHSIHVTMSIGLAFYPDDAQDPEELIHQADQALYASKHKGRNVACKSEDIPAEVFDETKMKQAFPVAPMIQRDAQINKLKEFLFQAVKGESKFVLIKGAKGVGKSRLINEFNKIAHDGGITSININCLPETSNQPYQVLIAALSNLFSSLGEDAREFAGSLPQVQLAQLAQHIPALGVFLSENFQANQDNSSEQNRIELFKGIYQSLSYIVKKNALVLIIDDFHWVDAATLQLFNYILQELGRVPMLIVGAYQEEELSSRSQEVVLHQLFAQMCNKHLAQELVLEPLKKDDVVKIITAIFPEIKVSEKFLEIIYSITAGNPLFIEEVSRLLMDKGFIFYKENRWHSKEINETDFPTFLKKAIQKRVEDFDQEAKPVISAASIIGEYFNFNTLCQLTEQDPGFLLEALDRAKQHYLIELESPLQTDKFKFVNSIIRDVIYEGIDIREKQDLHRKLALIEEKNHQGSLDPVMGSLGYHFTKGQDRVKSDYYTQLLQEQVSQVPAEEELLGLLQDSLLSAIEEDVIPLSSESMKLVPQLIRSLRLAVQNIRLYPAHSAVRKGFVDQAHQYLTEILANDSVLVVGTAENRVLVNGEEISERSAREAGAGGFIEVMVEFRVKSINFEKGLSVEHLIIFLEGLNQNYDDLMSLGGLAGFLRKKGVSCIKVDEVHYVQSSKLNKQRSGVEEALLIKYLLGHSSSLDKDKSGIFVKMINEPQKLALTLEKMAEQTPVNAGQDKIQVQADSILGGLQRLNSQFIGQAKGKPQEYYQNIAQTVMSLNPNLRSKVLQIGKVTDEASASAVFMENAIQHFSDEQIEQVVKDEYRLNPGETPGIRQFIRKALADVKRRKTLAVKLRESLLKLGLDKEETSWMLGQELWQDLSVDQKAQRIIELTAENLLKMHKEILQMIDKFITELLDNNHYNLANEVIEKFIKFLDHESKQVRSIAVKILEKISAVLILKEKYFLLEQIINCLITKLDQEQEEVYAVIARGLGIISSDLLKKNNFIQATGILREFNLRMNKTGKLGQAQTEVLMAVKKEAIAVPEVINQLTKLLKEKIEGHHEFWELSQAIIEIGSYTVKPMFYLAISKGLYSDPFETYAFRWSIAKVLKSMDQQAVLFLKDRFSDESDENIKVSLELIGHMQAEEAVKYLKPLLKHKNADIRRDVISTLGKIAGKEAISLLSEIIKHENTQVRLSAAWALANIGTQEVVPLLKPLLKEEQLKEQVQRIIKRIEKK